MLGLKAYIIHTQFYTLLKTEPRVLCTQGNPPTKPDSDDSCHCPLMSAHKTVCELNKGEVYNRTRAMYPKYIQTCQVGLHFLSLFEEVCRLLLLLGFEPRAFHMLGHLPPNCNVCIPRNFVGKG